MFCYQCGYQIDDNSIFCKYCGAHQKVQEKPVIASFAFILREWSYSKLTEFREDRYINWETYYLSEEFAYKRLSDKYKDLCNLAKLYGSYSVNPIANTRLSCDERGLPINSLSNIIASFDYFHQSEGRNWRTKYDLVKVRLVPELNYYPNLKDKIYNYIFTERVILDDSRDSPRGYTNTVEVYTESSAAMERLISVY